MPSEKRYWTLSACVCPRLVNAALVGVTTISVACTADTVTSTCTAGNPVAAAVTVVEPTPVEVTRPVPSTTATFGFAVAKRTVPAKAPVVLSEKTDDTLTVRLWPMPTSASGFGAALMPTTVVKFTSTGTATAATPGTVLATVMTAEPFWPGSTCPVAVALATPGADEVNVRPVVMTCWELSL